jgi:hypothetical protein
MDELATISCKSGIDCRAAWRSALNTVSAGRARHEFLLKRNKSQSLLY